MQDQSYRRDNVSGQVIGEDTMATVREIRKNNASRRVYCKRK